MVACKTKVAIPVQRLVRNIEKAASLHLAPRRQHEASFPAREFDNLKLDLRLFGRIGCRHAQSEETPQGVTRRMGLIAFAAFRRDAAGAATGLNTRLQCRAIEDRRRQRFLSAFGDSQHCAQVVIERFKDLGIDPALRLFVDDLLGRQVVATSF
jgi:hypothetical protein